jgi:uncharacterized protein YkwD
VPWLIGALILGTALFIGIEQARSSEEQQISLLPGTPAVTLHRAALYAADDPWKSYLADEQTCPGGERTDLRIDRQEQVMVCLIDWARQRHGLTALPQAALLASTALQKAGEIVRCHNFAHAACGDDPAADVRAADYPGAFGEDLYIAGGPAGAPRVALDGWLNSPGHRENLFRPEWRIQGIALLKLDEFAPYHDMSLWVSHFGSK